MKIFRRRLAWCIALFLIVPTGLAASPSQDSGSTCGMYCIYAVSRFFGKKADIHSLVTPTYVSEMAGSTLGDLQRAATDLGLSSVPLGNMTSEALRASPYPIILHVRNSPEAPLYDHWVLFLGAEGGRLTIFDPPNPITRVQFSELAPIWDGNGLVVSDEPIDVKRLTTAGFGEFLGISVVVIVAVLALRLRKGKAIAPSSAAVWLGRSAAQGAGILACATLAGMLYHIYWGDGLLASGQGNALAEAYDTAFMPKLSLAQFRSLIHEGGKDLVIVDARYSADYDAGHVAGAVNIPIDSSEPDIARIVKQFPPQATVVVYCQSTSCEFADVIASEVHRTGIAQVMLYPGGWAEWNSSATAGAHS